MQSTAEHFGYQNRYFSLLFFRWGFGMAAASAIGGEIWGHKHETLAARLIDILAVLAILSLFCGLVTLVLWLINLVRRPHNPDYVPSGFEIDDKELWLLNEQNEPYRRIGLSEIADIKEEHKGVLGESAKVELAGERGTKKGTSYFLVFPGLIGYARFFQRLRSLTQIRAALVPVYRWNLTLPGQQGIVFALVFAAALMAAAAITFISIINPAFGWIPGPEVLKFTLLGFCGLGAAVAQQRAWNYPTSIERKASGFELIQCWIRRRRVEADGVVSVDCIPYRWAGPECYRVRLKGGQFNVSSVAFEHYVDLIDYLESLVQRKI